MATAIIGAATTTLIVGLLLVHAATHAIIVLHVGFVLIAFFVSIIDAIVIHTISLSLLIIISHATTIRLIIHLIAHLISLLVHV